MISFDLLEIRSINYRVSRYDWAVVYLITVCQHERYLDIDCTAVKSYHHNRGIWHIATISIF